MLPFFPQPLQDELLYSVCARYAALIRHPDLRTTLHHFFGQRSITAVADLPTHLQALADRIAHLGGPSALSLIEQYTLFPYYTAFQPVPKRSQVIEAMAGDGHPLWLLGLMASSASKTTSLRYCPQCTAADRQNFGLTYWHRSHQLPGVLVCHYHETWLEHSDVWLPARTLRQAFTPAEDVIEPGVLARKVSHDHLGEALLDLAARSAALLTAEPPSVTPEQLRECYLTALVDGHELG